MSADRIHCSSAEHCLTVFLAAVAAAAAAATSSPLTCSYVGAMPGRLISAVRKAGCRDPLLLLDEVDKMGHDHRWAAGPGRVAAGLPALWLLIYACI
jgi:hypothetical protein